LSALLDILPSWFDVRDGIEDGLGRLLPFLEED
jgi:hypothetical protein